MGTPLFNPGSNLEDLYYLALHGLETGVENFSDSNLNLKKHFKNQSPSKFDADIQIFWILASNKGSKYPTKAVTGVKVKPNSVSKWNG